MIIRVQPVNSRIHPLLFTSIHLVFHTGDLVGRYSCSLHCLVVWSGKKTLTVSLFRTVFIPLILFRNIDRAAATPVPLVIRGCNSDARILVDYVSVLAYYFTSQA